MGWMTERNGQGSYGWEEQWMKGLIHIYCGDGKGKTTAAAGLAIRAAGNGLQVLFVQFMKNGPSGELKSFERFDNIAVLRGEGSAKFAWDMNDSEKAEAQRMQEAILENAAGQAGRYDMLVLDEVIGTCGAGFLEIQKLYDFLDHKPEKLEVVLTGRNPDGELIRRADYVSEIKKVKHPYDRGIHARKGIEQ